MAIKKVMAIGKRDTWNERKGRKDQKIIFIKDQRERTGQGESL